MTSNSSIGYRTASSAGYTLRLAPSGATHSTNISENTELEGLTGLLDCGPGTRAATSTDVRSEVPSFATPVMSSVNDDESSSALVEPRKALAGFLRGKNGCSKSLFEMGEGTGAPFAVDNVTQGPGGTCRVTVPIRQPIIKLDHAIRGVESDDRPLIPIHERGYTS